MTSYLLNFFSMGGYGHFIWGAYGISAIVLIILLLRIHRFLKSTETKLQTLVEEAKKNET